MTVVQTKISREEHALLLQRAKQKGTTIKEMLRQIIREYLMRSEADSDDPFFKLEFQGREGEHGSVDHDEILYGVGE
ncbi:MAG: hypothetical protein K9W43_06620 [Candidatus Thorarchaeota archaeon]|nr:hypothetical protein [Candidatus Thorarchaeota archaeon]